MSQKGEGARFTSALLFTFEVSLLCIFWAENFTIVNIFEAKNGCF